ncbi:hypothetical protein ACS0TW_41765, partial [Klebsiella michiganensis]
IDKSRFFTWAIASYSGYSYSDAASSCGQPFRERSSLLFLGNEKICMIIACEQVRIFSPLVNGH